MVGTPVSVIFVRFDPSQQCTRFLRVWYVRLGCRPVWRQPLSVETRLHWATCKFHESIFHGIILLKWCRPLSTRAPSFRGAKWTRQRPTVHIWKSETCRAGWRQCYVRHSHTFSSRRLETNALRSPALSSQEEGSRGMRCASCAENLNLDWRRTQSHTYYSRVRRE